MRAGRERCARCRRLGERRCGRLTAGPHPPTPHPCPPTAAAAAAVAAARRNGGGSARQRRWGRTCRWAAGPGPRCCARRPGERGCRGCGWVTPPGGRLQGVGGWVGGREASARPPARRHGNSTTLAAAAAGPAPRARLSTPPACPLDSAGQHQQRGLGGRVRGGGAPTPTTTCHPRPRVARSRSPPIAPHCALTCCTGAPERGC